ncbi:D-alanine--D-alanine ligase [Bartonella sp. HY761]|uniref:D-alanine--D-alanine ligase n=1 Tax=Bartonella sp. HY761 TaxID=2979330 RepID=UPI00220989C8|nr:D-alanine--D-alanine ligase [Bartonella sp. HY761]UXN05528.1 D-alanine--D-alanine ligase [Bartonella sp. HY761]
MNNKHVAVLMGGFSSERPVSLSSGNACADALEALGFQVTRLDVDTNVADRLAQLRPDVAFNALHGPFGEDGTIQGILEFLKIPYTHSGVLASALAMDKARAKIIASAAGVKVAPSRVMDRHDIGTIHPITPPYVVKPVKEGSSFGVVIVLEGQNTPPASLSAPEWPYGDEVIVEQYIPGREFTCGVLGDRILDVCEIVPNASYKFYDYDAKYAQGGSIHVCPAEISPNIYQNIQRMALLAHQAIGCRGVSRSDFRFDEKTDDLIWLEVNTQPGMTPTSLVPDMAKVSGLTFGDLVKWIVEDASCMR